MGRTALGGESDGSAESRAGLPAGEVSEQLKNGKPFLLRGVSDIEAPGADVPLLEGVEPKKTAAERLADQLAAGAMKKSLRTEQGPVIDESIHKQKDRGGRYDDFAKMFSVFDELVQNAVPVEFHGDKYAGTKRADADLNRVAVLVSAFQDGDRIVPVQTTDIAYFYSEEKNTYLVTSDNNRYVVDQSLDVLSDELDPGRFFRISRSCIIAMPAIVSIVKYLGNRLKITARPRPEFEMVVSRSRVDDFLKWLEGNG